MVFIPFPEDTNHFIPYPQTGTVSPDCSELCKGRVCVCLLFVSATVLLQRVTLWRILVDYLTKKVVFSFLPSDVSSSLLTLWAPCWWLGEKSWHKPIWKLLSQLTKCSIRAFFFFFFPTQAQSWLLVFSFWGRKEQPRLLPTVESRKASCGSAQPSRSRASVSTLLTREYPWQWGGGAPKLPFPRNGNTVRLQEELEGADQWEEAQT